MGIVLGIALSVFTLLMVGATIIGLPGTWLMLGAAIGLELYSPDTFSWWTIGVAAALCVIGEAAEIASGAVGAKAGGASRKAIGAAVIGGIVGAILGTIFLLPIIGTIIGSALGAGLAASCVELGNPDQERGAVRLRAAKVGAGAAAGRFIAVVVKGGIALVIAILLSVASFV